MLFCCLWRNVEISCHKHFVVVFRQQQTLPFTTSDKCHNLPRSGGTMLITTSRSQRLQHAMKPDTDRKSWFLPTPPAFNATVRGWVRVRILPWRLARKNENGVAIRRWKSFQDIFIRFDRIHERADGHTQTDGRTHIAWRQRPRLCIN